MEKAEAVPPVFFRIKPELHTRLERVLVGHSGGRNDLAREGLLREIERLEAARSPVTPEEFRAIASWKKITGGKIPLASVLNVDMRDSVQREAALTTFSGPFPKQSTGPNPVVVRRIKST